MRRRLGPGAAGAVLRATSSSIGHQALTPRRPALRFPPRFPTAGRAEIPPAVPRFSFDRGPNATDSGSGKSYRKLREKLTNKRGVSCDPFTAPSWAEPPLIFIPKKEDRMDCSARPSANREKGGQTPASDLYCTQLLVTCNRPLSVNRRHSLMRLAYLGRELHKFY
jgi:hypothetical protein